LTLFSDLQVYRWRTKRSAKSGAAASAIFYAVTTTTRN